MRTFFLTDDIKVELIPRSEPISDAKFVFGTNGSIAAAGHILTQANATISTLIDESIGSEHWFTDESDFFRFYKSGQLHSLILSVPPENTPFDRLLPEPQHGFFSLQISPENSFFTVASQRYRYFDPLRRELYCFTENTIPKTVFKLTEDLRLVFNRDNLFSGWVFSRPIESITVSFQSEKDTDDVDVATYDVFSDYFDIVSDNEYARQDDEMRLVVKTLLAKLDPQRISRVKGRLRKASLTKALAELQDRFMDL